MGSSRQVVPVLSSLPRGLCLHPYPGHTKGCPNWNRRPTCPPKAPLLDTVLDLGKPVHCIYNRFDLGSHVTRMKAKHPDWSDRQARCCLYWQRKARSELRQSVEDFLENHQGCIALYVPEACGVDVTATMASIGIQLQWPPISVAYQVALAGTPMTESPTSSPA